MTTLEEIQTFAQGKSYWSVLLSSGKAYSSLDYVQDFTRGRRPLDWYLDIAATGDVRSITQLWLHTPAGNCALRITEPNSAYIFNVSFSSLFTSESSSVAQIVGRVDDKKRGTGIAFIWDAAQQQVYKDEQACVYDFAAWRPGIAKIGALNIEVMGVRL